MNRPYPFRETTPEGGENAFRADRALVGLAELFTRRIIEPRMGGRKIWAGGLGQVVEQAVAESNISTRMISPLDIARALGILKPRGRR